MCGPDLASDVPLHSAGAVVATNWSVWATLVTRHRDRSHVVGRYPLGLDRRRWWRVRLHRQIVAQGRVSLHRPRRIKVGLRFQRWRPLQLRGFQRSAHVQARFERRILIDHQAVSTHLNSLLLDGAGQFRRRPFSIRARRARNRRGSGFPVAFCHPSGLQDAQDGGGISAVVSDGPDRSCPGPATRGRTWRVRAFLSPRTVRTGRELRGRMG